QSTESDRALSAGPDAEAGTDEKQGGADLRAQESAPSGRADVPALDSHAALVPQIRPLRRLTDTTAGSSPDPACPLPGAGAGTNVPVTYDGLPGALVFRAPVGSTQQVDVFLCGRRGALRSLRLPAP
ncbi:hypothetical protein, partial [Nocardioides sp.]|uniref:hypothetical protein n=1 Tax=Nocardioides sp. TaxID=35761 RepID=UPI00286E3E44